MPIACKNWTAPGVCDHPEAVGAYGDHPSLGVCHLACTFRDPSTNSADVLTPLTHSSPPPPKPVTDWISLWRELHLHQLSESTPAFLAAFAAKLPCGDCKQHWIAAVTANPPPVDSKASWFAWTVDRHNDVSERIGKPLMSLADAINRWSL